MTVQIATIPGKQAMTIREPVKERNTAQRHERLPVGTMRAERQTKIEKGGDAYMTEKSFMTVDEVAAVLRVSKSKAYQIVRELNVELQKQGYLTVMGRVNTTFFHKKVCYSK